MYIMINRLINH